MADSAFLGLSQGLSGGIGHILIVLLFPLGFSTMIGLEQSRRLNAYGEPAYFAALAVGFHGVAESVAIGIGIAPASNLLDAMGATCGGVIRPPQGTGRICDQPSFSVLKGYMRERRSPPSLREPQQC